ncbi:MAG: BON domain-containing protein [Bacteroidales bacterium]|nr:BON domain-containing protein [Bacteroidales bacterium]
MKKIIFFMLSVLIAGTAFQSCQKSDSAIKGDVDKVLMDRMDSNVTSAVKDGVVTLTGTVATEADRMSAQNAVAAVDGVKSVMNNIMVPAAPTTPAPALHSDDTIKNSIESRLTQEGFNDVKVEVNNGHVTLSGDLRRADLTKVMQIANEAKPQQIVNNINLK